MERQEITPNLLKFLDIWKSGKTSSSDVARFNQMLGFAHANGIDLELKIYKSVLDKPISIRPIFRRDVIEFSTGTDEHTIIFDVLSILKSGTIGSRNSELIMANNYRTDGKPVLLIKNMVAGFFGAFLPEDVASLKVK